MNKKAEQFKAFLAERNINVFQMEEIPDNVQNAVVFRSFIAVEGQQLPAMLITDDTIFSIIRVQIVAQAMNGNNELELLRMGNAQNVRYKPFKLYFDESDNLIMDTCIVAKDGQLDGKDVYQMLEVIIRYLNENYREIMKSVWR